MRRLAALDDHAAADNGALFPVIGIIGLPVGNAMTCCRKDYACLVGNFGCTGCILKPLVTAVAGVICCVAFLRASRSLCGNEGQIVRMRYGLVISADVADVIAAVIVSRLRRWSQESHHHRYPSPESRNEYRQAEAPPQSSMAGPSLGA